MPPHATRSVARRIAASLFTIVLPAFLAAPPLAAAQARECGDPTGATGIAAPDALFTLRTAVGTSTCTLCLCDANGSGNVTAVDALMVLQVAVGLEIELACPACNLAPAVSAGPDIVSSLDMLTGAAVVTLAGSVDDDGEPGPPANLTTSWGLLSGPEGAQVQFQNTGAASTMVTVGATGTFVLELSANDGELAASDTAQLTVTMPDNTAPVLLSVADATIPLGAAYAQRLAAIDDNPGDQLSFQLLDGPSGATLEPAAGGTVRWTPMLTALVGTHPFSVRVTDSDGLSDEATFQVTVVEANLAPMLLQPADATIRVGSDFRRELIASDSDGGEAAAAFVGPRSMTPAPLTFALVAGPDGMEFEEDGRTLAWTPTMAQLGRHAVHVRVVDAGEPPLAAVAMFTITVVTNTAPVAFDDLHRVAAGETLVVEGPGILANDIDPDGETLVAVKQSDPALGTLTAFGDDGGFTWQAPAEAPDPALAIDQLWRGGGYSQSPYAFPVVGDVNEDGHPDIVMSVYNNDHLAVSGLDGSVLWWAVRSNPDSGVQIGDCFDWLSGSSTRILADVDDDGEVEFVFLTACNRGGSGSRVIAFDHLGRPKWVSPSLTRPHPDARPQGGGEEAPDPPIEPFFSPSHMNLSVTRLAPGEPPVLLARKHVTATAGPYYDSDGVTRYAACRSLTGNPADQGQACKATMLIDAQDGTVLDVLVAPNPGNIGGVPGAYPWWESAPLTADLDGDGVLEILSGSDVWKQQDGAWVLAWQSAAEPNDIGVADLDGDGTMEVIHLRGSAGLPDDSTWPGGFLIFRHDGTPLRRIPLGETFTPGFFTVADVDGDEVPEILLASRGFLHALRSDGRLLWTFVFQSPAAGAIVRVNRAMATNVQVYDLDGDGRREVVVTAVDGLHILDALLGTSEAFYDHPGTQGFWVGSATFVLDADSDGHADVVGINRRGVNNCAVSAPDCNTVFAVRGEADNWLPGPKAFHQVQFRSGDVADDGTVLFNDAVLRSFRNPVQLGEPGDPRAANGTSFSYAASDGAASSNAATVFLEITPENSPPVFTSIMPTALLAVSPYTGPHFTVSAIDPDPGDIVTYEVVKHLHPFQEDGPWVTIDPNTGAVTVYTGPCGSFGGACDFGDFLIILAAVDQHGARTEQFASIRVTRHSAEVPALGGIALGEALDALAAVALRGTVLEELFHSAEPGAVVAQEPLAGASAPLGATVLLTISKGPQPVVTPNVVGLPEPTALTALETNGFEVTVIDAYDDEAPAGRVLEQTPAAGTALPPDEAEIVVSLGSGLDVRLDRDLVPASESIDVRVVAIEPDGSESDLDGAELAIEALPGPSAGPLPSINDNTITPASDTRGAFRVSAVHAGSGRRGHADFLVTQGSGDGNDLDVQAFSDLSAAMTESLDLLREARAAAEEGNEELMLELAEEAVLRWRAFDQEALRLSSPFATEGGLPPRVQDMEGFGVLPTFQDEIHLAVLEEAVAALQALVGGLREAGTPLVVVGQLLGDLAHAADRLSFQAPSEYGHVQAQPEYAVLAAHLLPDWIDALMNDLGATMDMEPAPPGDGPPQGLPQVFAMARAAAGAAPSPANAGLSSGAAVAGRWNGAAAVARPRPHSTIAEQLTAFAINTIIEHINVAKKFHQDVMKQARQGAMLVVLASHLRAGLDADEIVEIVSGASLSFRVFQSPYSFLEAHGLDVKYPQLNEVVMLGPDTVGPGLDLFEAIKGAKFDSLWASLKTLKEGRDKIKDFLGGADEAYANGLQRTHTADRPCIFSGAPDCVQLIFPIGFYPVYSYEPPPGFGSFVGLPLPIITLVRSSLTGHYSFATPPFVPFKPGPNP